MLFFLPKIIFQVPSSQDLLNYEQDSQPADGNFNNGLQGNNGFHGNMPPTEGFQELPKMRMLKSTEDITLESLIKRLKDR